MNIGLLLLHGFVGALLFAHGGGHLFGWFGAGGGLSVTADFMHSLELQPARLLAAALGAAEIAGGVLLALGLATPLGAAIVVSLLIVAAFTDHRGRFWIFNNGAEYVVALAVVAVSLAFAGAGRYSLDRAIGWDVAGTWWGIAAAVIAVAGAVPVLTLFRERAPRVSPQGA